jgi:hypothetical protein
MPYLLTEENIGSNLVEVLKSDAHCFPITSLVILQAMIFKELLDTRGDHRMAELRHAWEQVVLNLEVQVTHPPIDKGEWPWLDIHGIDSTISDPIHLLRMIINQTIFINEHSRNNTCVSSFGTTSKWVWDTAKSMKM